MSRVRRLRRALLAPAALFMLVALFGCATNWVVDSDVRSFSMDASLSPFADPLLYGTAFPEMANSLYLREVSIGERRVDIALPGTNAPARP